MSFIGDITKGLKDALLLTADVQRLTKNVAEMNTEMRQHDRRITTLEAQWNTAMQLSGRQGPRLD